MTEVWTSDTFRRRYYEAQNRPIGCAKSAQALAHCSSYCGFMRVQNCATAHLICTFFRRHHRRHENVDPSDLDLSARPRVARADAARAQAEDHDQGSRRSLMASPKTSSSATTGT